MSYLIFKKSWLYMSCSILGRLRPTNISLNNSPGLSVIIYILSERMMHKTMFVCLIEVFLHQMRSISFLKDNRKIMIMEEFQINGGVKVMIMKWRSFNFALWGLYIFFKCHTSLTREHYIIKYSGPIYLIISIY